MAATDRLIHYVCTASSHRHGAEPGLTRHDGQWALCPDLIGDGHEWQDTGGLEARDAVVQWRRMIGRDGGSTAA